jgi:hypothetical protein
MPLSVPDFVEWQQRCCWATNVPISALGPLPDQGADDFAARQRLVVGAFDVGAAVDHLVLLEAGIPLADLVHPHDRSVLPVPRGMAAGAGLLGAAQPDHPGVCRHVGFPGDRMITRRRLPDLRSRARA